MFNIYLALKGFFIFLKKKIENLSLNELNCFDYVFFIENSFLIIFKKNTIFLKEIFLRSRAELENNKKKLNEEIVKTNKYAVEDFAENILVIVDSLESIMSNNKFFNIENILEGVRLTLKLFLDLLYKKKIIFILPKSGDTFDPYKHLAVSVVSCKEKEDNVIINVLQKGYYIFERVLRPALVVVNKV